MHSALAALSLLASRQNSSTKPLHAYVVDMTASTEALHITRNAKTGAVPSKYLNLGS
jgi:hypothetical protein